MLKLSLVEVECRSWVVHIERLKVVVGYLEKNIRLMWVWSFLVERFPRRGEGGVKELPT